MWNRPRPAPPPIPFSRCRESDCRTSLPTEPLGRLHRAARAFPLGVGVGRYGERVRIERPSPSSRPLCLGFPRCRLGTSIGASSSGALLQSLDGALGLAGWRWLFLVQEPDPIGDRSTQLTVNHIRI